MDDRELISFAHSMIRSARGPMYELCQRFIELALAAQAQAAKAADEPRFAALHDKVVVSVTPPPKKFDKVAYQRDYMKRWRANQKKSRAAARPDDTPANKKPPSP